MAATKPAKPTTVKRRKKASERKEELIRVRCTAEQKRIITDAAEARGLDVSSWLRNLGIEAARADEKK